MAFVTQFTSEHYFCSWLVLFVYDRFVGLYHARCSVCIPCTSISLYTLHIAQACPMTPCVTLVLNSKSCCRSGHSALQATRRTPYVVGACHRTINGQEHKIICRAGPEQDMIFHLRVTACREQGKNCRDERLAGVASRWQGTSCSSSFVSKVF